MSKTYFFRANTCEGLVNRAMCNLYGIDKIYVTTGVSKHIKSVFSGRVAAHLKEQGIDCEYVFSPFCMKHYDGIIVRSKGFAIIDQCCMSDDINVPVNYVKLDDCLSEDALPKINLLSQKVNEAFEKVYKQYATAKRIHDEWEKVYITNMNFSRLNSFNDHTIERIFKGEPKGKNGIMYERFFGCLYADGHVNYIDNLTKNINHRYFIKGRPGTGKSTFMRRLASVAMANGYDTEVYYCSLDPHSYDMVVVRDLSLAVFDSTHPHEMFPVRNTDEILDFYVHSGLEGVDENYKDVLSDIRKRYLSVMSKASESMKMASEYSEKNDNITIANLDFEKLNNIIYGFLNEIL